jgi:transposase
MIRAVYLDATERRQLARVAETDPKPYRRERAVAILKVAAGEVAATVARTGLPRRHKPDTLYAWLDRWADAGIAGLTMTPGRGRKPAFSPPDLCDAGGG